MAEGGVQHRLAGVAGDLLAERLEADPRAHRTAVASSRGTAPSERGTSDQSPLGRPSSRATRMLGLTSFRL